MENNGDKGVGVDLVRVGPSIAIPYVLTSFGIDPKSTFLEVGLNLDLFESADNIILFSDRGRLLAHCVEKTQCSYLGLLVGSHAGMSSLGVVGLLMKSCISVEEALHCLIRYYHYYFKGATVNFCVESDIVTLSYQINSSGSYGSAQVGAGATAIIYNIISELCGKNWQANEVYLMQNAPIALKPYRKVFNATPVFNASQNAVLFSSKWLKVKLPEVDPMMKSLLQAKVDTLKNSLSDTLPDKVRRVLRREITTNSCHIEHVACAFYLKPRTFNRRLAEYGLQYKDLLDQVLFESAKSMLEDTTLSINEIAINLHYSDARSFIRAFKRWCDETPACWRKAQVSPVYNSTAQV